MNLHIYLDDHTEKGQRIIIEQLCQKADVSLHADAE